MSDISTRNVETMIAAAERFAEDVSDLRRMVTSMNAKVAALTSEVDSLKRATILKAVSDRVAVTGHGGTD